MSVRVNNLFAYILYQYINVPPFMNLKKKFHPHPTTLSNFMLKEMDALTFFIYPL